MDRWLVARSAWRDAWRASVALALIVIATVAAISATLTAATRSEDAFQRLRRATLASDATVNPSESDVPPTDDELTALIDEIEGVDGVDAVGAEVELFVTPRSDYYPDYNLFAYAPLEIEGAQTMDVPVIIEGRDVDPTRADELVLSERLAADLGVGVGDTMNLSSMTSTWVNVANSGGDPGPPDGPDLTATVVGIGRSPADFGRWQGTIRLSPAYVEAFGDQVRAYKSVYVRVADHAALESTGVELGDSWFADFGTTTDGLRTAAIALRLVALAVGLAGALAIAVALLRLCRLTMRDHETLLALGWSSRRMAQTSLAIVAPVLIGSIAIGVAAGAMFAPAMQVGLARSIDTDRQAPLFVWPVALACAAIALVFVAVITGVALSGRSSRRSGQVGRSATLAFPLRRPLPPVLGSRMALFATSRSGGRLGRGALIAGVVGVAAAVAALSISASISRLQTEPELSGQGGDRTIDSGESTDVFDQAMPLLERDSRVETLVGIHVGFGVVAHGRDGDVERSVLAFDRRRGEPSVALVKGRMASAPNEVMMGPTTLDALGIGVGDEVTLEGSQGSGHYRVVGASLFPEGDFKHDEGIALTVDGVRPLSGDPHDTFAIHQIAFEWIPSVDAEAADAELAASGFNVFSANDTLMPASVTNLGQVEALPRYVAVLVGLLALLSLANAIILTARLRTREWATLKALGITGHSTAGIMLAYGSTIALLSLAIGVPLGLIAGRQLWLPIADNAHVVVRSAWPWLTIGTFCTITIACALLMGCIAGWRVERAEPAPALRWE